MAIKLFVAAFVGGLIFFAFPVFADTYTWSLTDANGSLIGGNFETAENWKLSDGSKALAAPSEDDDVVIPNSATTAYTINVNSAFSIRSLTIGGGEGTGGATITFKHKEVNKILGDAEIVSGSKLNHTALNYVSLEVGGDVTIEDDAQINVNGLGYSSRNGPGYSGGVSSNQKTASASHGGRFATNSAATYGSLIAPMQWGSGSYNGAGGGVVRINASGKLLVNGTISANGADVNGYASGAGGSIYLTANCILGSGIISANGGKAPNGGTGSGGRVAIRLRDEYGFSNWAGTTTAYAGSGGKNERGIGSAGTVFLQNGERIENSITIIDNNNYGMRELNYVELKSSTDSASIGTLIVRMNGGVHIAKDQEVQIYKDINTTGGRTVWEEGIVRLSGNETSIIEGNGTYGTLVCEQPGKTLLFGNNASDVLTIKEEGKLVLRGDETNKVNLFPKNQDATWYVKLGITAKVDIMCANVKNSDASKGRLVSAFLTEDIGGNVNWAFLSLVMPGETIVWTGAESDKWLSIANWNPSRPIESTDKVVIPFAGEGGQILNMPKISADVEVINSLTIEEGAMLTLDNDSKITITNKFSVAGGLRALGSERIVCTKDVDFTGGTFEAGQSIFTLQGEGTQNINFNKQTFATIAVEKSSGSVVFEDGFFANCFYAENSNNLTMSFAPGETVAVTNLYLLGRKTDGSQALILKSSQPGSLWKLSNNGEQFVSGVIVSDSDVQDGVEIIADASVDALRNVGWKFDSGFVNARWIGGSGDYAVSSNWDSGEVPGSNARILISAKGVEQAVVNVSAPILAHSLFVSSPFPNSQGKVVFAHDSVNEFSGVVHLFDGACVSHATLKRVSFNVGGDVEIDDEAEVNAIGNGYAPRNGPGYSGGVSSNQKTASASHGGRFVANSAAIYGSVTAPVHWGSGSYNGAGGGVVRINASGKLLVNGKISANGANVNGYASGSGGSVYLAADRILGSGTISANGGNASSGGSGSGGRVSVCVASVDGLINWAGSITANAGTAAYSERGVGPAGTIYFQKGPDWKDSTLIVDNANLAMKESWYVELKKETDSIKYGTIILRKGGRVKLLSNARAFDLDLANSNVNFNTSDKILKVFSSIHKNGAGWAAPFANLVTRETNANTGVTGDIVWNRIGLVINVR
ncbi:MAG: hypothetical protein J6S51_04290 [Kiritimatiellae bacterium]|nr:hypothetical protein [Kiritimatiellia bacterium]